MSGLYAEKLPPHDTDAEEAVVGSLLIGGTDTMAEVVGIVKAADFYRAANRWCYEACAELYQRHEDIDQVSVAGVLTRHGRLAEAGGPAYLSHLIYVVPTSTHAAHYAKTIADAAVKRRLIEAAGEIAALGYDEQVEAPDAVGRAIRLLSGLYMPSSGGFVTVREVLDEYLEDTSGLEPMDNGEAPLPTGFADLDNALGRLGRGNLVILAARPSVGKSTLAMNIARNAAGQGARVAVFSLEMSKSDLVMRLLSAEAEVDSHMLRLGLLSESAMGRVMAAIGELSDLAIHIDDSPSQTVLEMKAKLARLHAQTRVDLLVVDYLQQVTGTGDRRGGANRTAELTAITREMKAIARDLNMPVLVLSQLNREIEQRPDHYPQLSDLRESGSIEQDADVVLFIHREDKYYTEDQWGAKFPSEPYPENLATVIVAKNRHGPTNVVHLYFEGRFLRFMNLATSEQVHQEQML